MKTVLLNALGILCIFLSSPISSQNTIEPIEVQSRFCHQFDSHSPFGICEDHFHSKKSIMVNYKYMPMYMNGLLSGTSDLTTSAVHQTYMVSPLDMKMDMHMYGIMYGLSDRITIMLMGNYIMNSMDLQMRNGTTFTTNSSGIGDHTISALFAISSSSQQSLHIITGLSVPTGDINNRSVTPMSDNTPLAYPMQLGSGTWDPYIGVNYIKHFSSFYLGSQLRYKTRLAENENAYNLGDELKANLWISKQVSSVSSLSLRTQFYSIGKIEGQDPNFNPSMMPLFNNENSSRDQIDISLGTNIKLFPKKLNTVDLGIEVGTPLYQNAEGIQMKNTFFGTLGIRYTVSNKSCH